MGLLFQPRSGDEGLDRVAHDDPAGIQVGREHVFRAALEALLIGDASRFDEWFTEDVVCASAHLLVRSRATVQRVLGSPEDSFTDVGVEVLELDEVADKVIAEWRLDAMFTRPLLFDDAVLIEPTGRPVQLLGMSVAEFDEHRIRAFRHYFDESEMLRGVPGGGQHVWRRIGA